MNLILLGAGDFVTAQRVRLVGRRLTHVREVHRAQIGAVLRVGVLNGRVGSGTVLSLDDDGLEMDVVLDRDPPVPAPVLLVLALPRPKALRRVLQCVAAMGVKQLVLLNSWRVEKSYWTSPALSAEALSNELSLGLEQGGDTVLPAVELRKRFKPFVEDELAALVAGRRAMVAHPPAAASCPHAASGRLALAVGPEGGFTAYEVDLLSAQGFEPISLGPRPLRVEHAVPALLGRLLPHA